MLNIKQKLRGHLLEAMKNDVWYHGSPDIRELELQGGFTNNFINLEYVTDIDKFNEFREKLHSFFDSGDMVNYHKMLDGVSAFKGNYKIRSPIFLTNDYSVAKTYANPRRSVDYQNAVEKIMRVEVDAGKNVKIAAHGDRFRFIELNKVKNGFINAGVSPEKFDKTVSMFNYNVKDKTRIMTDMIAAVGEMS